MPKITLTYIQKAVTKPLLVPLIIFFLLSLLVVYKVRLAYSPKQPALPSPSPSLPISADLIAKAAAKLPVQTNDYMLKAVLVDNKYRFYVTEKTSSDKSTAGVKEWFKQQGIPSISTLNIFWLPAPGTLPIKTKYNEKK